MESIQNLLRWSGVCKVHVFLMALSLIHLLSSIPPCHGEGNLGWWLGNSSELGSLCQTDDDGVGQHLGCTCTSGLENDSMMRADCAKKWIGFNDTLVLPPKLNVSRHVRTVDMSSNFLTRIDSETFGDCVSVEILLLNDNKIKDFLGINCPRLMKLDLRNNLLENLTASAFTNMRLIELDLSQNKLLLIEPLAFEQLKGSLRILYLGSNELGKEVFFEEEYMLSLRNMEKLEFLDISNSSLLDFPEYLLTGTKHLKKLSLRDNLIQFISSGVFEQLEELQDLDLSGNLFDEIAPNQFLGLKKLRSLTLDKMRNLKTIREHAFAGLSHLFELSCQMNFHLTFIDSQAFRGDPTLNESMGSVDSHPKIVRLGDNDLHYIDYPLLSWKDLEILELQRNNWVCDCNLQWVSDYFRHKPKDAAILGDSYFSCFEPHIFAGVPVVAVNPEEMLCFSPAATVAGTIGIVLFGILLLAFCSVIILNQMGMLPDWVRQYNLFGSGSNLPTYMRVNPRPNTKARRMVERVQAIPDVHCYSGVGNNQATGGNLQKGGDYLGHEPPVDELEWDNGDIGRT